MLGVDVGGTFTDVVAVRDGRIAVAKVPSSREDPGGPVVEGARRLGVAGSSVFNHASTTGLNAVLERRLPKIGFLTTDGFRDILDRGTVHRPLDAQTDPAWRRPFGDAARPLVPRYLRRGVVERMSAAGEVLIPLDEAQAVAQLELLRRCAVRGVAICLLHAYADARHEVRLRELAHEVLGPDVAVSISSETSPLAKEYARASTTVVDVLMKLLFGGYAARLQEDLAALGFAGELNFADCAASLLPWESAMRTPFRVVVAGPAAGTAASTALGAALGRRDLVCADAGGTSTDVSLVVGGRAFVQNTFELEHDLVVNALSTEVLLRESIARYGLAAVHGAVRHACDVAAERMAAGLAAIPDGDWRGHELVDCDGVDDTEEYDIHVLVRKRGRRVEVDLSGTSGQARSSINATALDVKTTVGIALKFLFDSRGRFCSGTFRDVDVVVPDGTILSALPPDGVVFMYFEQNQALLSALLRALAGAVGEAALAGDRGSTDLHTAFGTDADGAPWVSAMQCGGEIGPLGANRFGDADTQCMTYQANGVAPEIEAIEAASPVVVRRHEPVPDTAGPGYHRGGAAMLRDSLWLTAAAHNVNQMRCKQVAGFGVCGGRDGATGGVWVFPPGPDGTVPRPTADAASYREAVPLAGVIDEGTGLPASGGRYHYPFALPAHPTAPMTVLRYLTGGGGGWGDPLDREPERVLLDVRDGYVGVAGAARDYGVVVLGDPDHDPEGLAVDEEATARLRATRREEGRR